MIPVTDIREFVPSWAVLSRSAIVVFDSTGFDDFRTGALSNCATKMSTDGPRGFRVRFRCDTESPRCTHWIRFDGPASLITVASD